MTELFGIRLLYCERTLHVEETDTFPFKSGLLKSARFLFTAVVSKKNYLFPAKAGTEFSALIKTESSVEHDLRAFGCHTLDPFHFTSVNVTYVPLIFCTSAAVP
jgi:hypothetical protein